MRVRAAGEGGRVHRQVSGRAAHAGKFPTPGGISAATGEEIKLIVSESSNLKGNMLNNCHLAAISSSEGTQGREHPGGDVVSPRTPGFIPILLLLIYLANPE